MIGKIKRIPKTIYNDFYNILKAIICNSFNKMLVQFSISDAKIHVFVNQNSKLSLNLMQMI